MTKDEKIAKLGKEIIDRATVLLGKDKITPDAPEYLGINSALKYTAYKYDQKMADMYPETADFFERMAYLPLAGITELVPPGGAGIGMHVIPVEKAIPAESKSLPIEHLSHWLKKYEGHIGVSVCSCRKQQRIRGEGSGDVEGEWCIGVGDFADTAARPTTAATSPMKRPWRYSRRPRTRAMSTR